MVNNFDTLRKIWNESDSEDKGLPFSVDIENLVSAVFANGGYNTATITDIDKDGGLTTLATDGYMVGRNFCTLYELLIYNRPLTEDEFTIIKNELDLNRN